MLYISGMDKKIGDIAETLVRVLNKMIEAQKRARHYGLEEPLHAAEIHTIWMIGKKPGLGINELASRAGITKGAASQMVSRLCGKRLVSKEPNPESGARVALKLTNKGQVAFFSHERFHEEGDRPLLEYAAGLNPRELEIIRRFLVVLERGVDKRL